VGSKGVRHTLPGGILRLIGTACACVILFFDGSSSARAQAPVALTTDIPSESLAEALAACARQSGLQIVYVSAIVHGLQSKGAPAGLAPDAALTRLLEGTGLRFEFLNARSARILAPATLPRLPPSYGPAAPRSERGNDAPPGMDQEVIVTAQALRNPANRVPLSLAVWTRDEMAAAGIKDVANLANLTPGIEFDSYPDYGAGLETNIAVRGVNARDGSTTAIYLDDIPIPNDRLSAFGHAFPLTFDLDRVEVLRGPQGVLLGEGAEGGALRFITAQPSITELSGFTRGEYSTTARGTPSYEVGGAVGGPLVPNASGYRLSAWSRYDGGYVNRVDPFSGATVDRDANWTQRETLSAAVTLAPAESVRITPSLNYQSQEAHDTSAFYIYLSDPGSGVLKNGKLLDQPYIDRYTSLSLKASVQVNSIEFKAVTAYLSRHATAVFDNTNNSFWFWPNPLGPEYPVSYADAKLDPLNMSQSVLSEQVQLTKSEPTARVAWVAGAGYVHAAYAESQDIVTSALSDSGFIDGATVVNRSTIQTAAYGLLDLHLRPRLTATVGARVERTSYESTAVVGGIGTPDRRQFFTVEGSGTPVAVHFGLSFQSDDRNLYYATVAKAYRMGGPNPSVGVFCTQTPSSYGPDSLWSLEVGAKNQILDARLQLNTSVFRILWRNVQTQVPDPNCGFGYTINAGRAASSGFDFGAQAALTDRLRLKLTAAYADARYTQTVYLGNQVVATNGDTIGALPLVPAPWTTVASVDYDIPLASGVIAKLRAQDVFHSRNPGPFTTDNPNAVAYAPERRPDPSTNQLNLAASAGWPHLDVSLFVNNALDSQPVLQRRNRIPGDTLFYATTFRPRTLGFAANWRFGSSASP
jgi:iron complex outermembrane recepter protein